MKECSFFAYILDGGNYLGGSTIVASKAMHSLKN